MSLKFFPYQLTTKDPFGTAHGTRYHTDIVLVSLEQNGFTGYGEASMPPYYEESQDMMLSFLGRIEVAELLSYEEISEVHAYLDTIDTQHTATKCAIDIAWHDLKSKQRGLNLADFLNINCKDATTSMTIGIEEISRMIEKVKRYNHFPSLKVKLNGQNDIEVISEIRNIYQGDILVDANQAWDTAAQGINTAAMFESLGVGLIEQPFKKGALSLNNALRDATSIPIVADEDCQRLGDVNNLSQYFDGINIKLMKCTGIYEAMQMIKAARALNLKIMLGCMTESSIGISAASYLASMVDWCDLDGNLLISNDVARGVDGSKGQIILPKDFGIGVKINQHIDFKS